MSLNQNLKLFKYYFFSVFLNMEFTVMLDFMYTDYIVGLKNNCLLQLKEFYGSCNASTVLSFASYPFPKCDCWAIILNFVTCLRIDYVACLFCKCHYVLLTRTKERLIVCILYKVQNLNNASYLWCLCRTLYRLRNFQIFWHYPLLPC